MNEADSLKNELDKSSNDSLKIDLYCQITDIYANFRPDSALYFAQQGLELSRESGSKKGETRCLTRIGNMQKAIGSYPKALETILQSLKISEDINDQVGIAASYSNMAEIYKDQKDYPRATSYYFMAKPIFEKMIRDLESATKKEPTEINKNKLIRSKFFLATLQLNIGDVYEKMNQLDSSLFFQQQALALAKQIDDISIIGAINNNLGFVYFKKGKMDEAMKYYKIAIPYLLEIGDNQFLSNVNEGIAEIFEKKGQSDSAIYYAKKSLSLVKESSFQNEILSSTTLLSRLYESANNSDSALHYNKLAKAASDSLFNTEKISEVQKLSFAEKDRQRQIEEEKKILEEERQNNLQNLAIVIFIITFFAILFIVRRRKAHPKAIESLGLLGLLLMFEFISIFLHPYIGRLTHHKPIYVLLIYVGIASLLVPLHHRLNNWVKLKLAIKHNKIAAQEKSADKSIIHKSHKAHTTRKHK